MPIVWIIRFGELDYIFGHTETARLRPFERQRMEPIMAEHVTRTAYPSQAEIKAHLDRANRLRYEELRGMFRQILAGWRRQKPAPSPDIVTA